MCVLGGCFLRRGKNVVQAQEVCLECGWMLDGMCKSPDSGDGLLGPFGESNIGQIG